MTGGYFFSINSFEVDRVHLPAEKYISPFKADLFKFATSHSALYLRGAEYYSWFSKFNYQSQFQQCKIPHVQPGNNTGLYNEVK